MFLIVTIINISRLENENLLYGFLSDNVGLTVAQQ